MQVLTGVCIALWEVISDSLYQWTVSPTDTSVNVNLTSFPHNSNCNRKDTSLTNHMLISAVLINSNANLETYLSCRLV